MSRRLNAETQRTQRRELPCSLFSAYLCALCVSALIQIMSTPERPDLAAENAELRARLEEAEDTLRAIRSGEVDALVMGEEVYTLKGAETPYRLLIESMNEGAATLAPDGTILYCNRRFAEMVATPAEQVIGSCLWQWVATGAAADRALAGGHRPARAAPEPN